MDLYENNDNATIHVQRGIDCQCRLYRYKLTINVLIATHKKRLSTKLFSYDYSKTKSSYLNNNCSGKLWMMTHE